MHVHVLLAETYMLVKTQASLVVKEKYLDIQIHGVSLHLHATVTKFLFPFLTVNNVDNWNLLSCLN